MNLPQGESRLSLIKKGHAAIGGIEKRGRLVVGIDRLVEDPRNERKTFRNMDGLIASIKSVGLIEPITVTPLESDTKASGSTAGKYQIVTGHRRFRAAKAAGLAQVEVIVRDPTDELTRRQKSIVSNVQREDVGPVELSEALQALLDEDEQIKSQDDLARMIGKDKTWVSGMLRILSLPAELQRKVGTSQLAISYDTMIRIARLDDAKHQADLIAALVDGATNRQIRQRIDALKGRGGVVDEATAASSKKGKADADPKPKRVYHTKQQATVIVQSENHRLSTDRVIAALQEALRQARKSA
ncbi:MAG TPA: ParB/RepB/Spo0J family partition protein [Tepidisphaeraceae bacterium]